MVNIGINGFGRIGRLILRASLSNSRGVVVTAVNDPFLPLKYMAYLFQYDSVHGKFKGEVTINEKERALVINGKKVYVYEERDQGKIPWAKHQCDYVVESTGVFLDKETAGKHISETGTKYVLLSAPSKDDTPMFCYGVNHEKLTKDTKIFSGASCTTNCLAPLMKVLNDKYKVKEGLMTTIHASTATQTVVDQAVKKGWRDGRSALNNIIPAQTGAAKAIGDIIPELKGKLTGMAFRVPTIDGSVVDVTLVLDGKGASKKEIESLFKEAANGKYKEVFGYSEDELVSSDIIGDSRSSIFDANASIYLNNNFIKLVSWYDNEWGYSNMY